MSDHRTRTDYFGGRHYARKHTVDGADPMIEPANWEIKAARLLGRIQQDLGNPVDPRVQELADQPTSEEIA